MARLYRLAEHMLQISKKGTAGGLFLDIFPAKTRITK